MGLLLNDNRLPFRSHVGAFQGCNDFFKSNLLVVVSDGDQPVLSMLIRVDSLDIFQDSPCPGLPPSGITTGNGHLHGSFSRPQGRT